MNSTIYYLPGAGGRLDAGLGEAIRSRGYDVEGRELVGAFQRLRFDDRIRIVADDVQSRFWYENALVVANSMGAYLFLHALSQLPPYPGRVLLFSPIVGEASAPMGGPRFVPPYAARLVELAQAQQMPMIKQCEMHVGSEDWQSDPVAVTRLAALLKVPVQVVPNSGHMLAKAYVGEVLNRWLRMTGPHRVVRVVC